MNLNVGCGSIRYDDCINIDIQNNALIDLDMQANIIRLPFKEKSFEQVLLFQVLEHLERKHINLCLGEVWRVLEDEGRVVIACPDGIEVLKRFIENKAGRRWDVYHQVIFGRQLYKGDYHQTIIERVDLNDKLINVGFKDVAIENVKGDIIAFATKGEKLPQYLL